MAATIQIFYNFQIQKRTVYEETIEEIRYIFCFWTGRFKENKFGQIFRAVQSHHRKEVTQKNVARKNLCRMNSMQICQCAVKTRQQSLLCALDKRIAFQSFLKCSNVRFSFREKFSEFSDVTLDGAVICPHDKSNQVNLGCLKCSYNRLKICQYLHFN